MTMDIAVRADNQLGEGAVWCPRQRLVLWTDIAGKRFQTFDPATGATRAVATPKRLASFAPLGDGRLIAGFDDGLARFDPWTGAVEPIAAIEADKPTTRLNDGRVDRQGRFVFGTMDEAPGGPEPLGAVRVYDGRAAPRLLFDRVKIANSIAFSPDGRRMYFADTPTRTIQVFDYDPDDGVASGRRLFAIPDSADGFPDGSTVDADGCLWNAEWGGGRVVRYRPDGAVDRVVAVPAINVTCCVFGGADLATLFVTTARSGISAGELARQPASGALFAYRPGTGGLADTAFAGS